MTTPCASPRAKRSALSTTSRLPKVAMATSALLARAVSTNARNAACDRRSRRAGQGDATHGIDEHGLVDGDVLEGRVFEAPPDVEGRQCAVEVENGERAQVALFRRGCKGMDKSVAQYSRGRRTGCRQLGLGFAAGAEEGVHGASTSGRSRTASRSTLAMVSAACVPFSSVKCAAG